MNKLIGYARVSKQDQDLQLQLDALKKVGCLEEDIYLDKASGSRKERPGLDSCLSHLKPGDTLVVWRLDRLGRSMHHLVLLVESLIEKGVGFKSICDGAIDTTTASGELIFNLFSSLAQFEKRLIQERTRAGLNASRSRGIKGGRKKLEPSNKKVLMAKRIYKEGKFAIHDICQTLNISRATLYRYIHR